VDTEQILGMLAESYTRKGNDFIFTAQGPEVHDGTPITAKEIEQGYAGLRREGHLLLPADDVGGHRPEPHQGARTPIASRSA
jgi:hypothetical protein